MGEVVNMLTELRRQRPERQLVRSMIVVTERGETRLKVTSAGGAIMGDWPVTTTEEILAAAVMVVRCCSVTPQREVIRLLKPRVSGRGRSRGWP